MPNAATLPTQQGGTPADQAANQQATAGGGMTPFIRATDPNRFLALDQNVQLSASDQTQQPVNIPAYGYMRSLVIFVTTAVAGAAASGITNTAEDGPFSLLKNIYLTTPSGNVNLLQVSSGYHLYLIHKYGGYEYLQDPRAYSTFLYTAPGGTAANVGFMLRIPLELDARTGLGSLANKNAAAPFKLFYTVGADAGGIFGSPTWTTHPTVRIRMILETYDQPPATLNEIPTQQTPPVLNTAQFWTENPYTIQAGQFTPLFNARMGNLIRMFIPILRRASGTRVNGEADWPDPIQVLLDQRNADYIVKDQWKADIYEKWGYGALGSTIDTINGRDSGVFPYDFAHDFDGKVGHELRNGYLPTIEGTDYRWSGSWGNAGTLTMLTNDVVPTGNIFA